MFLPALRKISLFHLISWCGNFAGRYIFRIVSGGSPETIQKLCLSTKFPYQEIRWNYGILRSATNILPLESNLKNMRDFNWNRGQGFRKDIQKSIKEKIKLINGWLKKNKFCLQVVTQKAFWQKYRNLVAEFPKQSK